MSSRAALARHPLSIVGAVITTASAVAFIALVIATAVGLFTNPYAGLVIFIALPAIDRGGVARPRRRSRIDSWRDEQRPRPGVFA